MGKEHVLKGKRLSSVLDILVLGVHVKTVRSWLDVVCSSGVPENGLGGR